MEKSFWHEAWDKKEIGFHLEDFNPALVKFGKELLPKGGSNAFLPMCGKTLDLLWFSKNVENVYGVELSEKAVEEFFLENNLEFTLEEKGLFKIFKSGNISIYCGDLFKFPINELNIDIIFDRGALVALPKNMREEYLTKYINELKEGTRWLLCAFDYDQNLMEGPPFSVNRKEIDLSLSSKFNINLLSSEKFNGFETEGIKENVYLLEKN